MMSFQDTISSYWQAFFIIPLGFVTHKVFSLNATVKAHDVEITTMKEQHKALCEKLDKVADKIDSNTQKTSELIGRFDEHLRK